MDFDASAGMHPRMKLGVGATATPEKSGNADSIGNDECGPHFMLLRWIPVRTAFTTTAV